MLSIQQCSSTPCPPPGPSSNTKKLLQGLGCSYPVLVPKLLLPRAGILCHCWRHLWLSAAARHDIVGNAATTAIAAWLLLVVHVRHYNMLRRLRLPVPHAYAAATAAVSTRCLTQPRTEGLPTHVGWNQHLLHLLLFVLLLLLACFMLLRLLYLRLPLHLPCQLRLRLRPLLLALLPHALQHMVPLLLRIDFHVKQQNCRLRLVLLLLLGWSLLLVQLLRWLLLVGVLQHDVEVIF